MALDEGKNNIGRLVLYIVILIILLLLLVAVSSSQLLECSSTSLSFHMTIEHFMFLGLGALLATIGSCCLQIFKKRFHVPQRVIQASYFSNTFFTQYQRYATIIIIISCLAVFTLLMGIWHVPLLFAAATLHEDLHLIQHASFIISGSRGLIAVRLMPTMFVILSFVLMNAVMGVFGALLLVSNDVIFIPYSIESHVEAGNVMIMLCTAMAIVGFPAFIISRSLGYELKNQQNID